MRHYGEILSIVQKAKVDAPEFVSWVIQIGDPPRERISNWVGVDPTTFKNEMVDICVLKSSILVPPLEGESTLDGSSTSDPVGPKKAPYCWFVELEDGDKP